MDTSNMTLMEIFSNPDVMHTLSFGEKMLASTITMIMGLGITFTVLILIWIFIAIMGKVLGTGKKPAAAPAAAAPAPVETKAPVEEASDDSLVAVIAAAVAAYQGANANNLVVKKITRLSGDNTPWGASALEDRLDTRRR
ncbi:MAG: sodium pump decarboxylase subunit gamma [Clostridiales bacterium]|nr:sodium pump decarboxylase subunit gamma [Clostridiales bacterium]